MQLKKLRDLPKYKRNSLILSLLIVIYTLFSSIFISTLTGSINQTLNSLAIPNGYLSWDFGTPNPNFEISIGLKNVGLYRITDFNINLTLDLSYYDLYLNKTFKENFFQKEENIEKVNPISKLNHTIRADSNYFNISVLDSFWSSISNYSNIFYYMNISLSMKLFHNTIPCHISFRNLNLLMLSCINCSS